MLRRPARGFLRTSRAQRASRSRLGAVGDPVPFRPGSWDVSGPIAFYVVEPNDTMVGIAARYLGDGNRWQEIKQAQGAGGQTQWGKRATTNGTGYFPGDGCTDSATYDEYGNEVSHELVCNKTPFQPGTVFAMPEEAKQRMLALLAAGEPKSAPSQGNAPGNYPGGNPLEPYGLGSGGGGDPGIPQPEKPKKSDGGGGIFALLVAAGVAAALS